VTFIVLLALTLVFRKYESEKGIYYPPNIQLLIKVKKYITSSQETFPFRLILQGELLVRLHGEKDVLRRGARRLLGVVFGKPAGWYFRIEKNYKAQFAKDALKEAKEQEEGNRGHPTKYGLHAASKSWLDAKAKAK